MAGKAQIIPPPDDLRRKAVNFKKGINIELSEAETRKIEGVVDAAADRFASQIAGKLKQLRQGLAKARSEPQQLGRYLREVRDISLEIKGLGGTFNYPLLTAIAKSLNDFVRPMETADDRQVAVISHHVDALNTILAQGITGAGGRTEKELLDAFQAATNQLKRQ